MDIDVVERAIKSSLEDALKRMRQAEARLTKAQQAGGARGTSSWQKPWKSTIGAWPN
jgi:hypothetical protein